MPDIIQQIREKLQSGENAEVLHTLLPELFQQYDDGLIPVLPCKVGDTINQIWYSEADSKNIIASDTINRIAINSKGITLYSKSFCPINTKEFELAPIENYNNISYADYWIGTREAAEKALEKQQ
jgi:hypothetical protein